MMAAILSGGLGTRLRTVVADRPKVLAEVNGRPFLAFLLDQLAKAGVDSVVLCTGYMGEKVEEVFGAAHGEIRLTYSHEPEPLGTGGALRLALTDLHSQTVLVMNGDSYCEADLSQFGRWHRDKGAQSSVLLTEVPDTARFGSVQVSDEGRVERFEEKGGRSGPGWINAGIYLLARERIGEIPPGKFLSLEREVFPEWVGCDFYGYQSSGRFLDIGTPSDYASARKLFPNELPGW
jgi:D-glycero-alpha-D-manno-heptose 1-phosphate guanylyltransferase